MALAAGVATAHGIAVAQNHPYAGDHMVERHGRPMHGLYAIQVECDRSLYLDDAMDQPGPGLAAMQKVVAAIVNALAPELPRSDYAMAAEGLGTIGRQGRSAFNTCRPEKGGKGAKSSTEVRVGKGGMMKW